MGLFSSKKKTIVGTVAQRVIEDDKLPNAVRTGVQKAIFAKPGEGDSIPEYVMEELIGSVGIRAERMFKYGQNKYAHGLPSGQMHAASSGRSAVQAVLNALEGQAVLIEYSQMGPPNNLHMGWMQVMSQYGYNPTTNQLPTLSATVGETVYLEDLKVVVPAADVQAYRPGSLDQWGTPATAGPTPERDTVSTMFGALRPQSSVYADVDATEEYVDLLYTWQTVEEEEYQGEITEVVEYHHDKVKIPLTGLADDTQDYFHVKYRVGTVTKYWMYRIGSGTHPTLDALFNVPPAENGTFFPFGYFRYGKVMETADKTTESYKTGKKLMNYLGMGMDAMCESIEENPDIANVEQAMLMMAVPANTENELEQRYLFTFFENLFFNRGVNVFGSPMQAKISGIQSGDTSITKNVLVIQDKRFKMTINDNGIYKRLVPGTIGSPGTYGSGRSAETYTEEVIDYLNDTVTQVERQREYHYYRKQISAGLYEEITLADLEVKYFVSGDHAVTADDEDKILLIPLDRSITESWTIPERETLYARSLHYIFNSLQIIKIKWYQTGLFKAILVIIAVVIAFYTGQFELVAAALGGSTVAALTLLTNFLIGMVISKVLKIVVKAIGGELAMIIAAVAFVIAGAQMMDAGSLAGAPWAQELLQLSSGLTQAVSANLADDFKALAAEEASFNLFKDGALKDLEAANKLLETDSHLSPFVIFGEKPDEFYNRTIHSGNIGVLSIGAISNFVDTALRLPKLDDTLGESAYG